MIKPTPSIHASPNPQVRRLWALHAKLAKLGSLAVGAPAASTARVTTTRNEHNDGLMVIGYDGYGFIYS